MSLPPHLRSRLARLAAIHRPLTATELLSCWGDDFGGTEGEAIIVGRGAYPAARALLECLRGSSEPEEDNWDTPLYLREGPERITLYALALCSTILPPLSFLPPSLTHLSLLRMSFDTARLARVLPKVVPLLEYLDIYECEGIDISWCESVDWRRWVYLKGVRLGIPIQGRVDVWHRLSRAVNANRGAEIELLV